jgi:hypothetical protein
MPLKFSSLGYLMLIVTGFCWWMEDDKSGLRYGSFVCLLFGWGHHFKQTELTVFVAFYLIEIKPMGVTQARCCILWRGSASRIAYLRYIKFPSIWLTTLWTFETLNCIRLAFRACCPLWKYCAVKLWKTSGISLGTRLLAKKSAFAERTTRNKHNKSKLI